MLPNHFLKIGSQDPIKLLRHRSQKNCIGVPSLGAKISVLWHIQLSQNFLGQSFDSFELVFPSSLTSPTTAIGHRSRMRHFDVVINRKVKLAREALLRNLKFRLYRDFAFTREFILKSVADARLFIKYV